MKRDIFYNTLYQMVNMVVPIVLAPYLSRTLGASGVGLNSYVNAVAGYFVLFSMLGLNQYGNRTIAFAKDSPKELSKTFWEIYTGQAIVSIAVCFCYGIMVCIFCSSHRIALSIYAIYVVSALFDISWFYFGISCSKICAIRNIIVKILTTVLIFIFVKKPEDVYTYIFILNIGIIGSNLVLWLPLKKYISIERISLHGCLRHIKPNLILFVAVFAVRIYKLTDKIMLGSMSNIIQNGLYENMSNVITMPLAVITAVGTVMLPRISEFVKFNQMDKIRESNRNTIQIMLGLSIPFTIGVMYIADDFVPLFFGEEFNQGCNVLKILVLTSPFITFANVIRTQYLIPFNKDRVYLCATILGAASNLVVNFTLIPRYGAFGAAIGTLIAEIVVCIYQYFKAQDLLIYIPVFRDNYIFIFSSIIMACMLFFLEKIVINRVVLVCLQVIIGAGVYLVCTYFLMNCIDKTRLKYWKEMFGRTVNGN